MKRAGFLIAAVIWFFGLVTLEAYMDHLYPAWLIRHWWGAPLLLSCIAIWLVVTIGLALCGLTSDGGD